MLLAVVTTANAWAQRGKRAIERIDRDVQTRVFIPKGTWMVGGKGCCRKRLRFRHQSIRRLFFP